MSGHGTKRDRKREAVIAALLSQPSEEQAAKVAGVSPATVRRMKRDPAFDQAYQAARRKVLEDAIGDLQGAAREAVATLRALLKDPRASMRLRASLGILVQVLRGTGFLELLAATEAERSVPKITAWEIARAEAVEREILQAEVEALEEPRRDRDEQRHPRIRLIPSTAGPSCP